jgi:2-phosphosulfolactate phosphatase
MRRSVVIDCFPDSARHYVDGYAIVAIDVIRATTTAVTAVSNGRRCFPVPSLEAAVPLAARLDRPILVGELGGNMPYGWDLTNSPVAVNNKDEIDRPMILLSSSGTLLIERSSQAHAVYLGCLRNWRALARYLEQRHARIAVLGAGTRGEFRDEDQLACAWIAGALIDAGFHAEDSRTTEIVERWREQPVEACANGNSAAYLRRSGQERDLEFVLAHVDDLDAAFMLKHDEVVMVSADE